MSTLFIICGLSFAGKSTLGRAIAERFGHEEVDVDKMKIALYGTDGKDERLTPAGWEHIYAETDRQILLLLKSGKNVIDASRNFTRAERNRIRAIVSDFGYAMITIYINIPEAIARQRWQANRKNPTRRDVPDSDFEAIIQAMEPPSVDEDPVVFHSEEAMGTWLAKNIRIFT